MGRLREELPRKAVHIGMGACALLLRWLTFWQAALVALAALVFNLFLLHRLTGRALLRRDEKPKGFSLGIALYPLVVLVLILVFHRRLELAAAAWGLLAFGDGMATVTGMLVGGPRLPWNREKTWSGLAGFVLWGTAASAFLIRWTQRGVLDGFEGGASVGDSLLSEPALLLPACFAAALAAAFAESADTGIDDNLLVPLVGGSVLYAATLVEVARLLDSGSVLATRLAWGAAINGALALAALAARGVGRSGAVWGWVLGTALYAFAGWRGFLMLVIFFVLGTATTKMGYRKKAALGIAQERGGRRGARNAFANVSAGLGFAFLALATPHTAPFTVAMIAAFATATCDTVSSEIGQAYGRHHFMITSLRRVRAGTGGAVSVEGTLAGLTAAAAVAVLAWWIGLAGAAGALAATIGGFAGATFESYLDATAGSRVEIDNELINFLNTVVGALAGLGVYALIA